MISSLGKWLVVVIVVIVIVVVVVGAASFIWHPNHGPLLPSLYFFSFFSFPSSFFRQLIFILCVIIVICFHFWYIFHFGISLSWLYIVFSLTMMKKDSTRRTSYVLYVDTKQCWCPFRLFICNQSRTDFISSQLILCFPN